MEAWTWQDTSVVIYELTLVSEVLQTSRRHRQGPGSVIRGGHRVTLASPVSGSHREDRTCFSMNCLGSTLQGGDPGHRPLSRRVW